MGASVEVSTSIWSWSGLNDTDSDSSTWRFWTPGAGVTITWTDGPATVNGITTPATVPAPTEMKFFSPGATPGAAPVGPAAQTFIGFTKTVGNAATSVTTSGTGSSASVAGVLIGTNWTANWTLSAGGVIAMGPTGALGSYEAEAEADDPMPITNAAFDSMRLTQDKFNLYFPVTLDALALSTGSKGGIKVGYRTDDGKVTLLELSVGKDEVIASGNEPDFLKIYRQRAHYENPMALGERPWSLQEIKDSIAFLSKDGVLSHSFGFGFLLTDLPRPTREIGDGGVVAEVSVSSSISVSEAAGTECDPKEQQQRMQ